MNDTETPQSPQDPMTGNPAGTPGDPWPVYHRVMMYQGLLSVVCLQGFDEADYDPNKFLRGNDGQAFYWLGEDEARQWLGHTFKTEAIHPSDRLGHLTPEGLAHLRR